VYADLFRGALVGGLALVAAFGDVEIWMLWLLAFGLGTGEVFFDNSSQTLLPRIVPEGQLARANGYFFSTEVATNMFMGMPLGSVLFGFVVWLPFGIDAASFVVAALLAASLRGSFRPERPDDDGSGVRASMSADIQTGFRWLRASRSLRNLAIAGGLVNFALAGTQATFVLFAIERLGISDRLFGPVVAVIGVGSLVTGIFGGRIVSALGQRLTMILSIGVMVLSTAAIFAWPVAWFAIAMTTVHAMMITLWSIVAVTLRQRIVPDHLFGRVNGIYRWVSTGASPLGALGGSLLADWRGLRAPYLAAAWVLAFAAIAIVQGVSADAAPPAPESVAEPEVDETPVSMERDPLDDFI
jgi:predicted MFS family arabinose efflux permease